MVLSPSCSGAWASSARRTVRANAASIRFRPRTSPGVRSSNSAEGRPCRSSAASPSRADISSLTTPPQDSNACAKSSPEESPAQHESPGQQLVHSFTWALDRASRRRPETASHRPPDCHARRVTEALDHERCCRAVAGRGARFDGWFFTAVHTTGSYCRPSCPARTPLARNVSFFTTAAGAQSAGFRACRRCRPDAVPGSPEWDVRADVVARAMRLIADGEVERSGVPGLAARLGYSERQLHRLLVAELGVGPLALA